MKKTKIIKLTVTAMLYCLGLVLPFLTSQIPQIGNMLLPMHLPVFLCGFICGPIEAALIGFLLPLTRSLFFGMPNMYPTAIGMCFELLTYGLVSGLIYKKSKKKNTGSVYISLVISMLSGRLVWGIARTILMSLGESKWSFAIFISHGFINAIPGIIMQLLLIPVIMGVLTKWNILDYSKTTKL